jgi:hypothetical protein
MSHLILSDEFVFFIVVVSSMTIILKFVLVALTWIVVATIIIASEFIIALFIEVVTIRIIERYKV